MSGIMKLAAITCFVLSILTLITAYKLEKLSRDVYNLKRDYIEFRQTKHGYDHYFNK